MAAKQDDDKISKQELKEIRKIRQAIKAFEKKIAKIKYQTRTLF